MTKAPERIYLTDDGDSGYSEDAIYWSATKVYPRDTQYVRMDLFTRQEEKIRFVEAQMRAAEEQEDHWHREVTKLKNQVSSLSQHITTLRDMLSATERARDEWKEDFRTARADALKAAAEICDEECHNLNALTCNPPKSAAAWGARNRILSPIDKEPSNG